MRLKTLVQVVLISSSILALGACARHKNPGENNLSAMNDVNNGGAQASGLGQGDGFTDQGGTRNMASSNKRTYYFDFDKSDVRDADKPAIIANADRLVAHPQAKVILEGHTDPRGSREYNVALGERRGQSVSEVLKSRGVNPDQVRVVSYGAQRPAAAGHTEDDYQLDRRAIITAQK